MKILRIYILLCIMLFTLISVVSSGEMPDKEAMDRFMLELKYSAAIAGAVPAAPAEFLPPPYESMAPGEKSRGKAFLFSFLLPGAGEYYLGKKGLAKTFFFSEIALWSAYFSFRTFSDWKRDDMYAVAASHAGADIEGKHAQYYVDLGNYMDIYEYNDAKQRLGEFFNVYSVDEFYWSWDSASNKTAFEKLRVSSAQAHDRSNFAVGAIIANHVISAIDAVWQSNQYNKKLKKNGVSINIDSAPDQMVSLRLTKTF